MIKTSVIILNYNGIGLLKQFLPGVVTNSVQASVVVADNGSNDGSADWVRENYPEVTILAFTENYGFAEGYNRAIAMVETEYVVLLNSDVEVTPDWLGPLENAMESDARMAACQPKLKSYKSPAYFEYAGAAGGFIDFYGYPFCRGRIMEYVEQDHGQYDSAIPIFWATGACLMIRRKLYNEVGGLDKDFFAHMEEIDLCWRLNARGYNSWCIPQSEVYHVGGATLNEDNPHKTYLNFRNNALMLYKNLPADVYNRVMMVRWLLDLVAATSFWVKGNKSQAKAVLKARKDFKSMRSHFKEVREDNLEKTIRKKLVGQLNSLLLWRVYIRKETTFSKLPSLNEKK